MFYLASYLRQHSAENVAAEIEFHRREHRVREIAFVDDTFTIRPQGIRYLFRILDGRGISFPWTCMSRINTVDEDLLKFMRDRGCWHISFGIESGNEEILRRIKKKISLEQTRRVVDCRAKPGIRTKGFFIVGHPRETEETIEQTIRCPFAREIGSGRERFSAGGRNPPAPRETALPAEKTRRNRRAKVGVAAGGLSSVYCRNPRINPPR